MLCPEQLAPPPIPQPLAKVKGSKMYILLKQMQSQKVRGLEMARKTKQNKGGQQKHVLGLKMEAHLDIAAYVVILTIRPVKGAPICVTMRVNLSL